MGTRLLRVGSAAAAWLALATLSACAQEPPTGEYRAWLGSPGGELPFGLTLFTRDGHVHALVRNGVERISLPGVRRDEDEIAIPIPHFASEIRARVIRGGDALEGTWRKRALGAEAWSELPFHAVRGREQPRFRPLADAGPRGEVAGRWRVAFESSEHPAVGLFEQAADGRVNGTFLTTTGDYRYLAGSMEGDRLRLSCFDGAHAFLFDARLSADGTLAGDFWSRNSWHETWTAVRDEEAALPDAFTETQWTGGSANALCFPDLEGNARLVGEPAFWGKARLLVVFGSWCPNCHDEARFLAELDREYRDRGLSILGLAFELSGDFDTDVAHVRAFQERHGVEYPVLLAGTANKPDATAALGTLSFVKSFPTTIFLDEMGNTHKVHSGWAGPATGEAHDALRAEFVAAIEELLADPGLGFDFDWTWRTLNTGDWWDSPRFSVLFGVDEDYARVAQRDGQERDQVPVRTAGDVVVVGDECWILSDLGLLYDPRDLDRRLRSRRPLGPDVVGYEPVEASDVDFDFGGTELIGYLDDSDPMLRAAAAWAAGIHGGEELVPRLHELLPTPNPLVRREAARALLRLAPEDEAVLAALASLVNDPHPLVRAAAAGELSALTSR